MPICRPKSLPLHRFESAARRAVAINPANAVEHRQVVRTPAGRRGGARRLAVVVGRRWPASGVKLTVQFLDGAKPDLRRRILSHMNAWSTSANVAFVETASAGQVRIARLDAPDDVAGYWSYLGTEILEAEEDEPTMNLEGFTMRTPESEFRRVVRHEAGHTLGFDHEHLRGELVDRIDPKKAIAYYDVTDGWTPKDVRAQVLTPLSKRTIMGTSEVDPLSIMCYQIPGEITKDGKEIPGGTDINAKDRAFAASIYPKRGGAGRAPALAVAEPAAADAPAVAADAASPDEPVAAPTPAVPGVADDRLETDTMHIVIMDSGEPRDDAAENGAVHDTAAGRKGARRITPEFARVFATYGGARVTTQLRLRAGGSGTATRWGAIIETHERIRDYTNRVRGSLPGSAEMMAFGGDLFQTLFQGEVRRLYDEARSRQRQRKLDIVLTSMIPWIGEKPWEFAYDRTRESFLATEDVHFIRNVLTAIPADPLKADATPLRILVASAQPIGFGHLSIDEEVQVIRRGFESLIEAGLVVIETLPRATPEGIHAQLQTGNYDVVHFIGHGVFDEPRQEGYLVFQDARGGEFRLGRRSVRELFCGRGLSLVFLNACQTGQGGSADFNKGVAQALVQHGLPALVANQYSVLDSSATSFAQHFYWSLAQGQSIGAAAREARIAVNYSLTGELIDWAVPVVYARDPNAALCARRGDASTMPDARVRRGSRRRARVREYRIAVWDIDDVFPALQRTLDQMTGAQEVFELELVDMSVPLDAWDLGRPDEAPYLNAERLAGRLKGKAVELDADLLCCVTRHRMRAEGKGDRFSWWPTDHDPRVALFSVAGFGQIQAQGPDTDRAIANATVSALAGFFGEMVPHPRGAKDCPMARHEKRDLRQVVGRLKFDAHCRRLLRKVAPEGRFLPALEALLKAFP